MTTTTEITTVEVAKAAVVTVEEETTVTTIEVVEAMEIPDKTNIEIKNTLINCRILMISIITKEKEWSMQMQAASEKKGSRKIEASSIIREEEVEEVVEVVGTGITLEMTTKMLKHLEKEWHPTSNMSIRIIEATIIVEAEVVVKEITIEAAITVEKTEVTIVETTTMIQDKTTGKMILTRSHIMNLRKISNKKK